MARVVVLSVNDYRQPEMHHFHPPGLFHNRPTSLFFSVLKILETAFHIGDDDLLELQNLRCFCFSVIHSELH